jgi:cell filamentation protein
MVKSKYSVSKEESENDILPNKLKLTTLPEVEQAELEGFLLAYKTLFDDLSPKTRFNLKYIMRMHKRALGHLYSFAGKWRTVNISKGGFMFPPAKFLSQSMKEFEKDILNNIPDSYNSDNELIVWIARVHGEFLFIHPFREGNGRTARLLANLMCAKAGHKLLDLENFSKNKFEAYVEAVKSVASRDYSKMEAVIRSLF